MLTRTMKRHEKGSLYMHRIQRIYYIPTMQSSTRSLAAFSWSFFNSSSLEVNISQKLTPLSSTFSGAGRNPQGIARRLTKCWSCILARSGEFWNLLAKSLKPSNAIWVLQWKDTAVELKHKPVKRNPFKLKYRRAAASACLRYMNALCVYYLLVCIARFTEQRPRFRSRSGCCRISSSAAKE